MEVEWKWKVESMFKIGGRRAETFHAKRTAKHLHSASLHHSSIALTALSKNSDLHITIQWWISILIEVICTAQ